MLPTKPQAKSVSFTIGSEIMLPTLNFDNKIQDQKIDFFCQMGPGQSLMRDILWTSD